MTKYNLSENQIEALEWASKGKTYGQIAELMEVSQSSVNKWIQTASIVLGGANVAGSVGIALREGVIK